jgi:valyl-tRNA synthetase
MLDKNYQALEVEEKIYKFWEENGYFIPIVNQNKKPFTIILPLPNANDPLHMGHALFAVEDIMIRYHRMLGDPTLWLPGADHAGIETQFVFEKYLAKKNQSRFDFDRKTLYQMIWDFVEKNREVNKNQLKKLGFSLDWTRYHYSLEPNIVKKVIETFQKLFSDNLIYRGERIVNFCTKCGTAFSELEVNYQEKNDFLYYLDYKTITIATTRPETIFADVAVAVNPSDKKYQKLPKQAFIPLIDVPIPLVKDKLVQADFGTGALKITPGYDPVDFEIGQKNNLPIIAIMKRSGHLFFKNARFQQLNQKTKALLQELDGLKINKAREKTVEFLEKSGNLIKKLPYQHSVGTCYRCGTTIEPIVIPQWFIKIKPLAQKAIEAVRTGETKIVPRKRFEKMYFDWLNNIKDWNISRQIVWGPRIPVWYCLECNQNIEVSFLNKNGQKINGSYNDLRNKYSFDEISSGIQFLIADQNSSYQLTPNQCRSCQGTALIQETDTFDTWFLSGQWPINTLKTNLSDFNYFYPTSVLDTLWDILPFWVSRMMMLGIYLTKKVPFRIVHLHARVVDGRGQKMSKSKGNTIDPLTITEKYGADALRLALVLGVAPASDIALSEEKIRGMRNFGNKLWNIGRFLLLNLEGKKLSFFNDKTKTIAEDKEILIKTNVLIKNVTRYMEKYHFGRAAELLYQFTWHEFADQYLELSKNKIKNGDEISLCVFHHVFLTLLKLLHPFIPFVTEEIWQAVPKKEKTPLIISSWPHE